MPTKLMLKVEDELWEKFKSKVPRTKTLNEAVVDLISDFAKVEQSRP